MGGGPRGWSVAVSLLPMSTHCKYVKNYRFIRVANIRTVNMDAFSVKFPPL